MPKLNTERVPILTVRNLLRPSKVSTAAAGGTTAAPAVAKPKGPSPDTVRGNLWGPKNPAAGSAVERNQFQATLLEQYKLYAEMADRVSARRATMNGYFLSLNTAIATGVSFLWELQKSRTAWVLVFPLVVLLLLNRTWYCLIRSYRQLNAAKFAVIGAMEEQLSARMFWDAEWTALKYGDDRAVYRAMSELEQDVPIAFTILYVIAFVVVVVTHL